MTHVEGVAVADIQCAIASLPIAIANWSVLGLPGVRAAHRSADNKDHKADQDKKNLLRLVEAHHVRTCMKHGTVMAIHLKIAKSVLGLPGVRAAQPSADDKDHKANRERKYLLRLVEAHSVLTYTKHGTVMSINRLIAN